MVKYEHKGKRSKTRAKYTKRKREKGKPSIEKRMQEFNIGDYVHISVDSSIHEGMPFRRFTGKTGRITGKQGSCYCVKIKDVNAEKEIIVHPAHLKLQIKKAR